MTDQPGCAAEYGLAGELSDETAAACLSDGQKSTSLESEVSLTGVDVAEEGQHIFDIVLGAGADFRRGVGDRRQ